ncbi:FtsX-like permease family protein [Clostridiaceae bacterium 68-1-5]|uniref:FtsX-like permease family protein n=1 Tax=Suipraeoptans intestinalis TaxID=2606628 RepID=A0A6N7UZ18_9FIRM|nr:FtsX-like permease family protein [Suipraeoptans intestinalis]MSR92806.1 FtsX-like permease family protein [Suipraeoptans intestinalis]
MQKLITRLALTNLKKNKEIYIPYMISGVLACAFYYIFTTLSMNPEIEALYGGKTIGETLRLGGRIIALAAGVIVLYANSFTMKRRMVEMGLYSVLGLEKRHIGRMAIENLLVGCTVMVTGLVTGMLLDKLSYAVLLRVMRFPVTLNSFFSVRAVGKTGIVFGLIFLAVIFVNCWKIMRYNPLALMKENEAERKKFVSCGWERFWEF